jgi:hypothetical protein
VGGSGGPFVERFAKATRIEAGTTARTEADPYGMTNKKGKCKRKGKDNGAAGGWGLAEVVGGFSA